jgi:hypothetical protein
MKKLGYIVVGALVMGALAVGTSLAAGGGGNEPRPALWGGGHFEGTSDGFTLVHDFSVNVEQGRFGQVGGSFIYGHNGVGTLIDAEPSCIAAAGNRAVIGGTDRTSGLPFIVYFVDNGTPVSAVRDQMTPVALLSPEEVAQLPPGSLPTNFPAACPSASVPIESLPYFDVSTGDVVVRGG